MKLTVTALTLALLAIACDALSTPTGLIPRAERWSTNFYAAAKGKDEPKTKEKRAKLILFKDGIHPATFRVTDNGGVTERALLDGLVDTVGKTLDGVGDTLDKTLEGVGGTLDKVGDLLDKLRRSNTFEPNGATSRRFSTRDTKKRLDKLLDNVIAANIEIGNDHSQSRRRAMVEPRADHDETVKLKARFGTAGSFSIKEEMKRLDKLLDSLISANIEIGNDHSKSRRQDRTRPRADQEQKPQSTVNFETSSNLSFNEEKKCADKVGPVKT
ncbi:hypothetical protein H4R33_004863 [Dimargaris cristalligena]|uniref:Uncharacterized protein n=1 Tax=Dimargaris cristalligena TaxID=215637 RepID=A0A4P9ZWE3_9FUNG|nr:hypothetical protein H4R33_004863 [Dimargaris cristalligena]RKP37000.1 hypothetical protein BJ085DRAFT_41490 [Dimargaris cristalligena]|eukprot:RKP37000.1 hypothetical protein BJ085DRAFT_41490 [Dimargaris cristalligena]